MSIKTKCTACLRELEVPDEFAGRKGKCPFCLEVLDIPAAGSASPGDGPVAAKPAAAEQPKVSAAPAPAPTPAAPAAPTPNAVKPAPAPAARKPVRLAVVIPAAAVVVVAAFIVLVVPRLQLKPSTPSPAQVVQRSTTPAPKPEATQQAKPEVKPQKAPAKAPAQPAGLDRFPETQQIAAAVSNKVSAFVEIRQPRKLLSLLAAQPIWKSKTDAAQRCESAYTEICRILADRLGPKESDTQQFLRHSNTVYLAFDSLAEWPIIVADVQESANRERLFGEVSSLKPVNTLEFDRIAVEEYKGEAEQSLYIGYHQNLAVLGGQHDLVQAVLKRLRDESPDSLMNNSSFVQALATRVGEGTWVYISPKSDQALVGVKLINGLIAMSDLGFIQASMDPEANCFTGSVTAEGVLAAAFSGSAAAGVAAAYAPADSSTFLAFSAKAADKIWNHVLSTLLADQEQFVKAAFAAAQVDPLKDVLPALGPEFALVVHKPLAEQDLTNVSLVAQVADAKRLRAALDKLNAVSKGAFKDYRNHKLFAPPNSDVIYALGEKAIIVGGGETVLKHCIDAALDGKNMAAYGPVAEARKNGAGSSLVANIGRFLQEGKSPLLSVLKEDASTCVAAHEEQGAIRISGDLNALGVLCAQLSDTVMKRQFEVQREKKTAAKDAEERCRQNMTDIYEAINKFLVKDMEENLNLQYPISISEVIDGGLLADVTELQCPSDKEPEALENGEKCSYDFVFSLVKHRLAADFALDAVVLWERNANHGGKHLAVYVDGNIAALTSEELKKELEKAKEAATSKAPRKVDIPQN